MAEALQIAVELPPRGSRRLVRALKDQLAEAIRTGRLAPGLQLPPSRALAAQLAVSRNTVTAAYDLLLGEGYLRARQGAGVFVAGAAVARPHDEGAAARLAAAHLDPTPVERFAAPAAPGAYDLRAGLPELRAFPAEAWRRAAREGLRQLARSPPGYGDPAGRSLLREAVAGHVSFARAVACRPDDVLVTAGAQQAFRLLGEVLVRPGRTVVAVEEPGYPPLRAAFAAAGALVRPVPVDAEGLVVEALPPEARIVCVTPSHQFPLGMAMSPARRAALLAFAAERDALVVEDDYDGEFRFDGRALDALQTLDGGERVFYVGTFSKSLYPGLRLGYLVAPRWAFQALAEARAVADRTGPYLAQETVARLIESGELRRHVRRMSKLYAARRGALLEALARRCGPWLEPVASSAGLHLAALFRTPLGGGAVVARCREAGVALQSLSAYAAAPLARDGLVFGYGALQLEEVEPAIAIVADACRRCGGG